MRTDMADINSVIFALIYPEDRSRSTAMVRTVLEGEDLGIIPALPATPEYN